MRALADNKTGDLLPGCDLAGERPPKLTQREKTAIRVKRYRETHGLRGVTANLPADLVDEFHAKRAQRGHSVNKAIEILLRTQYLRKR